MNTQKKSISIQLTKSLAERIHFLRRIKKKAPNLNDDFENALLLIVQAAEKKAKVRDEDWVDAKTCPVCTSGVLSKKFSPRNKTAFYGCNNFPECRHSEPFANKKGN